VEAGRLQAVEASEGGREGLAESIYTHTTYLHTHCTPHTHTHTCHTHTPATHTHHTHTLHCTFLQCLPHLPPSAMGCLLPASLPLLLPWTHQHLSLFLFSLSLAHCVGQGGFYPHALQDTPPFLGHGWCLSSTTGVPATAPLAPHSCLDRGASFSGWEQLLPPTTACPHHPSPMPAYLVDILGERQQSRAE